MRMPRFGRYSFLGSEPFLVLTSKGCQIELETPFGRQVEDGNPFLTLRRELDRFRLPACPGVPFTCGAVGFLSYDLGQFVERLPCTTVDDIHFPEMYFAFYDRAVVYDHQDRRAWLVAVTFPGVAGALCLLLFAISAQVLPISTIGVLLIVLALVMFVLEIKVTSFGMLTLGGAVSLVIGGWMLVEGPIPELRVPMEFVLPMALAITLMCAIVVRFAIRAQRAKVTTGREGLVGKVATVTQDLDPRGTVFVHGEIWNAITAAGPIAQGSRVKIIGVDELVLTVAPVGTEALPTQEP